MALWLLDMPDALAAEGKYGFDEFSFDHNGKIHFDIDDLSISYIPDFKTCEEREVREQEREVTFWW